MQGRYINLPLHFFDCPYARMYWALANVSVPNIYFGVRDPWEWINGVKKRMDAELFEFVVVLCWSLWYNRNKVLHKQEGSTHTETFQFVM